MGEASGAESSLEYFEVPQRDLNESQWVPNFHPISDIPEPADLQKQEDTHNPYERRDIALSEEAGRGSSIENDSANLQEGQKKEYYSCAKWTSCFSTS